MNASQPPPLRNAVKTEVGPDDEDAQSHHLSGATARLPRGAATTSALDFLALWRLSSTAAPSPCAKEAAAPVKAPSPAPTTSADPRLGTLFIGAVVFAPHRVCADRPARMATCSSSSSSSATTAAAAPPYHVHYALAEVTGVQLMAGTVSVSFLFTEPGVDDEAVSMYECVPCPPSCLVRWLREGTSYAAARCSLLERVMHVSPEDGPLPVSDIHREVRASTPGWQHRGPGMAQLRHLYCLSDDDDDAPSPRTSAGCRALEKHTTSEQPGAVDPPTHTSRSPQRPAQQRTAVAATVCPATPTTVAVITARYASPTSIHVFFSHIFQHANEYMERRCSGRRRCAPAVAAAAAADVAAVCAPPVVLVLFDSYATLRRFHVFMTVRGHVVQLLDGADGVDDAVPAPRTAHAFGAQCKVWLCMLRDDTGESDAAESEESHEGAAQTEALMDAPLRRLLAAAPPVDALLSFKEQATGQCRPTPGQHHATAEAALERLLPHLGRGRLVCELYDVPGPSVAPAAPTVVKVSGAVYGERKLLVPCSREQLALLSTVWAGAGACECNCTDEVAAAQRSRPAAARSARKRPREVGLSEPASTTATAAVAQALTPALLERIALGSFTDAAATTLFDVFADSTAVVATSSSAGSPIDATAVRSVGAAVSVLSSIESVYEKWCIDPSRLGEAFPLFAAVYAVVADVCASPARFRVTRPHRHTGAACRALPRIALVLPRGNPTHHPNLSTQQYLRTLHSFFAPWTVHTIASSPGVGNTAPVLWHQRGGLLLLFCDETATQLGALQDEADVVIACGKAAAAWVAANSAASTSGGDVDETLDASAAAPVLFAVISEVEVVASVDQPTHLWLPAALASPASGGATAPTSTEGASLGELDELWDRLLAAVGTDGGVAVSAQSPPSCQQQQQQQHGHSPVQRGAGGAACQRFHQAEVLPRTLRQAVVLWRHLQTADIVVGTSTRSACKAPPANDDTQAWVALRAVVREMALSCATAMPVRMIDVSLRRRSESDHIA